MEVELGVNLADAFTKKHRNNHSRLESRSLAAWGGSVNAFGPEGDSTGLLPAGYWRNGDRQTSWELGLDDVAQESLRKALLEDPNASLLAIDDGILLDLEDPDALRKTAMVEFLYAFEKFRIVYA
ncbi:hypothetical protein BBJ28_00016478 [Nothophytophthora sp. Chile5]|nr:hypothetical protein BBJ28_00016478 [Nothophytophthora sp. Chile5]